MVSSVGGAVPRPEKLKASASMPRRSCSGRLLRGPVPSSCRSPARRGGYTVNRNKIIDAAATLASTFFSAMAMILVRHLVRRDFDDDDRRSSSRLTSSLQHARDHLPFGSVLPEGCWEASLPRALVAVSTAARRHILGTQEHVALPMPPPSRAIRSRPDGVFVLAVASSLFAETQRSMCSAGTTIVTTERTDDRPCPASTTWSRPDHD